MPRILVITGAGISAESGIPTFRGKDGYWRNFDPARLATPEAFDRDPKLVWEWYRERRVAIRKAHPNAAHTAITKLASQAADFLLVTQNVDDLHLRAEHDGRSMAGDQIMQIHGDIFVTRCSRCLHQYRETGQTGVDVPLCRRCGAMMRPGVVWFGEVLDGERIATVEAFLSKGDCHCVLVIGTTAMFGYIVDWALRGAGRTGRLIEINPEPTSLSRQAVQSLRQPAGAVLPRLIDDLLRTSN